MQAAMCEQACQINFPSQENRSRSESTETIQANKIIGTKTHSAIFFSVSGSGFHFTVQEKK